MVNHWSNIGQVLANHWSTTGQLLVNHQSTTGQLLITHWPTAAHQEPQVLLCRAPLQQVSPELTQMCEVIHPHVQDPTLALDEPPQAPVYLTLQPAQILLNGSTVFWCVSYTTKRRALLVGKIF